MTLKVWLRASADDYDFVVLARMFAVGDTRFHREGVRCYLTNRELDEVAVSGEVPDEQAKTLLSLINGYAVVHDSTYHPIELDNLYTMPGEDKPRRVHGPGLIRKLQYPKAEKQSQRAHGMGEAARLEPWDTLASQRERMQSFQHGDDRPLTPPPGYGPEDGEWVKQGEAVGVVGPSRFYRGSV